MSKHQLTVSILGAVLWFAGQFDAEASKGGKNVLRERTINQSRLVTTEHGTLTVKNSATWGNLAKSTDHLAERWASMALEFAEHWGALMEGEINRAGAGTKVPAILKKHAKKLALEAGFEDQSPSAYASAVKTLGAHWKYGKELLRWHNSFVAPSAKSVADLIHVFTSNKTKQKRTGKSDD